MSKKDITSVLERAFERHAADVEGLCYRMTGSRADAEELAQETFVRLRESPPEDLESSLRAWLLRVASNLCRDHLNKRNRIEYTGPWLPAPAGELEETGSLTEPERQVSLKESARYAFLVALEELKPDQRSVLLLRDVYGLSVRETANTLNLSESNTRVIHHRARKRLSAVEPNPGGRALLEDDEKRQLIERLTTALFERNEEELRDLFAEDVRVLSDGGEFAAATRPIEGRSDVTAFLQGLQQNAPAPDEVAVRRLNGCPALVIQYDDPPPRQAPRVVLLADSLDGSTIDHLYFVMASDKVDHLES
jgi:RNA polymerase sigma-70 factor (ECF subfamily)